MTSPTPAADHLLERISELEARFELLQQQATARRKRALTAGAMLLGVSCVLGVSSVLAADGACPNGLPFCFGPGTPARAFEVNHNFAQLLEWLQAKVGPVSSSDLTVHGSASIQGDLSVRGAAGDVLLSLDGGNAAHPTLAMPAADGTLGVSRDFAFQDSGDNWLRLRNNANDAYSDLAVRDLWIDGTVHFAKRSCRQVLTGDVWAQCGDGEFVAGIDFDNNGDGVGGVLCCRF